MGGAFLLGDIAALALILCVHGFGEGINRAEDKTLHSCFKVLPKQAPDAILQQTVSHSQLCPCILFSPASSFGNAVASAHPEPPVRIAISVLQSCLFPMLLSMHHSSNMTP